MTQSALETHSAPIPGQVLLKCHIKCDVRGYNEDLHSRTSEDALDERIPVRGWKRFGPSGSDLCHKCAGGSPNTIVQVRK